MYKVKFDHFLKAFSQMMLIMVLVSICCGCSQPKTGKWEESTNGMKVYVPVDFDDKYDKSSLRCENTSEKLDGVDIYGPVFEITVKEKTGQLHKFTKDLIPSIVPKASLEYREKGNDNVYWLIAGKRDKKARIQGYAFKVGVCDNVVTEYEYGDFDNNKLTKGYRALFNQEGERSTFYCGKFKDGHLFQGYQGVLCGNSICCLELGVWDKGDVLDKTYLDFCAINYSIFDKLGYSFQKKSQEEVDFTRRYFFWQNYKWYILLCLAALVAVILYWAYQILDFVCDPKYNRKVKPWSVAAAYGFWLLGPIGFVYLYLRNRRLFCCSVLLWVGLIASAKFLILYGLEPKMWPYLVHVALNFWQTWIFVLPVLAWVITFFTIPYQIYKLNFLNYRHNLYEDLISRGERLEYEQLCQEIAKTVKNDAPEVERLMGSSQYTYNEELDLISMTFSFLTNAKVNHARDVAENLHRNHGQMVEIAKKEKDLTRRLRYLLRVERDNAYKNMTLAKELIFLIKKAKDRKQTIKRDNIEIPNIQAPIELEDLKEKDLDFADTETDAYKMIDSSFATLKNIGFNDKASSLISIGIGVISFIVGSILEENARRNRLIAHYNKKSAQIIEAIKQLRTELVKMHGQMLRAQELLKALSKVNVLFVKTYNPLRDYVFGTEPSFSGYLKHIFRRHKKKAANLTDDIALLITICNEYNKINNAEL